VKNLDGLISRVNSATNNSIISENIKDVYTKIINFTSSDANGFEWLIYYSDNLELGYYCLKILFNIHRSLILSQDNFGHN